MAALLMMQSVPYSLQLLPGPVSNQGTIGALEPKCGSPVVTVFMLQGLAFEQRTTLG